MPVGGGKRAGKFFKRKFILFFTMCQGITLSCTTEIHSELLRDRKKARVLEKKSERQTDIHTQAVGETRERRKHLRDGDLGV